jgi:hypothetical protein
MQLPFHKCLQPQSPTLTPVRCSIDAFTTHVERLSS